MILAGQGPDPYLEKKMSDPDPKLEKDPIRIQLAINTPPTFLSQYIMSYFFFFYFTTLFIRFWNKGLLPYLGTDPEVFGLYTYPQLCYSL